MPVPPIIDRALFALGLRHPRLSELSEQLRDAYDDAQRAHDLWELPEFKAGVATIAAALRRGEPIDPYAFHSGPIVALMAVEATAAVESADTATQLLLRLVGDGWSWTRQRALQLLPERASQDVIAPTLVAVSSISNEESLSHLMPFVLAFVRARAEAEAAATFGDAIGQLTPQRRQTLTTIVTQLESALPATLMREVRALMRREVPLDVLRSIGRVWDPLPDEADDAESMPDPTTATAIAMIEAALTGVEGRSTLVVGDAGTGKTALIRQVGRRLQRAGWVLFEASAAELIAGQSYIGQLEGRMRKLLEAIGNRDVVWIVPSFHELGYAGATVQDPGTVLDQLLPWVDRGVIRVLGETRPPMLERLAVRNPRLRTAFSVARLEPLDDAAALRLAEVWCARAAARGMPSCDAATCREAVQLARQYLTDQAQPGALLKLLRMTADRQRTPGQPTSVTFGIDDVYETLGALTGLPQSLLDDRRHLGLDALRDHFEKRVLGQPEAVDRIVERVAMVKAGVSDPRRPLGVFLFVGPTGTGKTEIARTLAEFLFGSSDRMIRLDMSEFQTPESIESVLGDRDPFAGTQALVHRIRRQPFSVVLLDEFEKAHPRIWDLFLQVFDDGRLTDRRGDVADFRHAIVILTSNLGAAIPAGARLGFQDGSETYAPASVMRVIERTFRREFINRLDHIVVFRPLARATMRQIVVNELAGVFRRRGLRNRAWAVEWDDAAIDFLLDKGFTRDLGARPLRRAIEQHLLAPLATTIVRHEVPAGDQFLFVSTEDGKMRVRFVDPDAPDEEPPVGLEGPAAEPSTDGMTPRDLVLDARGAPAEMDALQERLARLESRMESAEWQERRAATYAAMQAPGFWRSPERFVLLGRAENLDRVRAALRTAASLRQRLAGAGRRERHRLPVDVVRALAHQVYLLETAVDSIGANEPWEAFLSVRPLADAGGDDAAAFAARLVRMYEGWARQRHMQLEVIEPHGDGGRWIAAVSGLGALRMLRGEQGLHVHESDADDGRDRIARLRVEVRVAPQPPEPAGTKAALAAQAATALAASGDASAIVRRYRDGASPLVRDAVRGFRTGRVDRVYAGNFDLLS